MSLTKQSLLLFMCLFAHVFLFNLVVVTPSGPTYYWQENLNIVSLLTYLLTALVAVACFVIASKVQKMMTNSHFSLGDKGWFILSMVVMAALIGLMLL